MRRILTGLLAAVLTLGLLAAGQAEAKVYKMKPEERAAALKEKKDRKARKKAGKATADAPGGWVEVKPGTKPERKSRKSTKVDEVTKAAEKKGQKDQKGKKAATAEARPEKKSAKKSEQMPEQKTDKKADKKNAAKAEAKTAQKSGKAGRKQAADKGDRLVSKSYSGETKVHSSGIEVRRPGDKPRRAAPAASGEGPADKAGGDLNSYSVQRPGHEKPGAPAAPAIAPEVRQPVQPGPVDSAKPVGTEQKSGEGRF